MSGRPGGVDPPAYGRGMTLRSTTILDGTWEFTPDGGRRTTIPVPAHWTHGACFGLPAAWAGVRRARYARTVVLPAWRSDSRLEIGFGAVMLRAAVRIDGLDVGGHAGGFTPFACQVPDGLWRDRAGCAVRLEVEVESGHAAFRGAAAVHQVGYPDDSEEGPIPGGIWQGVELRVLPARRIAAWRQSWNHRTRRLDVEVDLAGAVGSGAVRVTIGRGAVARRIELPVRGATVAGQLGTGRLPAWTWREPRLHPLRIELLDGAGRVVDRLDERIGLREVGIRGGDFLWNGERVRMRGISLIRHRVAPYLWRRDYLEAYLGRLRRLGFNAVRLHAAIAPPLVLRVCDELGMLVIDQSAVWSSCVQAYTLGGEDFVANTCREYDAWIARDRNHPCVIAWDVENEMVRICPAAVAWVDRLIAHVRTRSGLPVLASGAGVLSAADAVHLHCFQHPHRLQPAAGLGRPFIQGEWWGPDQPYRDTLRIPNRILPDPASAEAFSASIAAWYGSEIAEHRLRGAAGTFPFALEVLLFRPLFAHGERLPGAVAGGPDLPAVSRAEVFHRDRNYHVVRRPLVNPGWRDDRPDADPDPAIARAIAAANAPVLVAVAERHRDLRGGRTVVRTVRVANDSGRDLAGTVEIRAHAGSRLLATARARLSVPEGAVRSVALRLRLPAVARQTRVRLGIIYAGRGHRASGASELWLWPAAEPATRPVLPVVAIGVAAPVARALRRFGATTAGTLPEAPAVAVLGRIPGGVDRPAVERFLAAGGRVVVLRQESDTDALPLPCRIRRADEEHRAELVGIRREPTQCTWLEEADLPDPAHPAVAGLAGGRLRPFAAGDHRLADHAWLRPGAVPPPLAGPFRCLVGGFDRAQAAVVECAYADGLIVACQLRLTENLGRDPQADAVLAGLVGHAAAWTPPAATVSAAPPLAGWLGGRIGRPVGRDGMVRVVAGAAALRLLREAGRPASATRRWLEAGGTAVVALPPGGRDGGLRAHRPRGPVLCAGSALGWTSLEADPLIAAPDAALLGLTAGWTATMAAVEQDPAATHAGMAVGGPAGAVLATRRVGRGAIHATGLPLGRTADPAVGLLWDLAMAELGIAASRRAELADDAITARATAPFEAAGDLVRWTNEQPDVNIAPWSRAVPVAIDERHRIVREVGTAPPGFQRAALCYLLHDAQHLYVAAQMLAPAFDTANVESELYRKDSLEVRIGGTYLLASWRVDGTPFLHAMGSYDDPGVAAHVAARITRRAAPAHLPDLARLRLDGQPAEVLIELRIPWSWLRDRPADGAPPVPAALAFNASVDGRRQQYGFPANHAWNDRSTWGRLVLSPQRR